MKKASHVLTALALAFYASSSASAQTELPTSPALERAIVIEEIEHDARQALTLYQEIASDTKLAEELRRSAALRLGRVQAKLGNAEAARAAFEQAAKGEDAVARLARADLTDPGQDEERARLLREEARRWIEEVPTYNPEQLHGEAAIPLVRFYGEQDVFRSLLWMGPGAAPELVRAIERQRALIGNSKDTIFITHLAYVLWHVGGPEAVTYLTALRLDDNVRLRRAVTRGLTGSPSNGTQFCASELVPVAQGFLDDPDPDGHVQAAALGGYAYSLKHQNWRNYELSAIFSMLDSPAVNARVAALDLVRTEWENLRHGGAQSRSTDMLLPRLARALEDVNPRVVQSAYGALGRVGLLTEASRALLIERLPRLRSDFSLRSHAEIQIAATDRGLPMLLPMLRVLGPNSGSTARDHSVSLLMAVYLPHLRRDSLELVLEYLRLGYDRGKHVQGWIEEHCDAEDAESVLVEILSQPQLEPLLDWVSRQSLSASCWPSLRVLAERYMNTDQALGSSHRRVLIAMGKTAAPEALEHLVYALQADPGGERYYYTIRALLLASAKRSDPDILEALRSTLVLEINDSSKGRWSSDEHRQVVFARLIELGDPRAFELMPRAYEMGMQKANLPSREDRYPGDPRYVGWSGDGVEWLTMSHIEGDTIDFFHGYDEATLLTIWDALLSQPFDSQAGQAWRNLHKAFGPDDSQELDWERIRCPTRYLAAAPRLVELAARNCTRRAALETEESGNPAYYALTYLLDMKRRKLLSDPAANEALTRLHAACFLSPNYRIRRDALRMLPREPDEAGQKALLSGLTDQVLDVAKTAMNRVFTAQQAVPSNLFQLVLENPNSSIRYEAITNLAPFVEGGAAELVKARLIDDSSEVRIAACRFLATQIESNPVPELLVALRDLDQEVRSAAADALRAIRFYHDEKAHWDRVFAGTELSTGGAAEALLKQAAPSNTHEVRLLAIRSLGTLGAAETLPFLIEWTTDSSAELSGAARAAIARIHAKGN